MAVLRAFQATDMRAELGFGIPAFIGRFEIVIEDIARTTTFFGDFFFPGFDAVNAPWLVDLPIFDPLLAPAVEGTLFGYRQDRFGVLEYEVQGLDQDAFAAFFALFRLDDTDFFQALAFSGDDVFFGSRRGDVLIGYAGADQLWGYDGDDGLAGGRGTDTLYGLDGDDALAAGAGRDWLWGGDDDDTLVGGPGRDFQTGGDGADSFRYRALADSRPGGGRRDLIRDFGDGLDRIDLRPLDASLKARGDQPFAFIGEARFSGTPGELRFAPGPRLVQGDTDGDARPDFEIELGGSTVPDADDFLL